jgi:hypothetical protein
MERYKIYSPLTDKELIQKAYWWIEELIKTGGKAFVMHVPAQLDHDTDLVFFNLAKRFDNLLDNYAALQAKCDRYEATLKMAECELTSLYRKLGFKGSNILKEVSEALSGEGEKTENAKEGIVRLILSNAAEVSKDAESAKEYLRNEGVDVTKLADDAKFVAWLAELSKLLHEAAQGQPIKINQEEARKWYDDGCTPYQCFRETWNME